MGALLETVHLKKYFKTSSGLLHAVDDVSISIDEGKTLGVVGESGCGKSTLGRVILRLLEATDGQVIFDGENILDYSRKDMRKMRNAMQIIFQDPYSSLNPRMTVEELIAHPLKVNKIYKSKSEIDKRTHELMDLVGLAERTSKSYPHELDGGRRQRIGIARALALEPRFIVCDEPVSALDVSIQAQILNLMMDLQDELHLTYMFIPHNMAVVKHISDKIAVMYLGQCIEMSETQELFDNPKHPYTQALLSAIPRIDIDHVELKSSPIQGELTSPINPAPGCRFAKRCPYATEACMGTDMVLTEEEPDHFVTCRRVQNGEI